MLWHKGWLETRWRFLFALAWAGFGWLPWTPAFDQNRATVLTGMFAIAVAGAGIATQLPLRAAAGLHGSTCFTLSLPVSRFQLLAVRAALGWLEMTAAIGAWYCGVWILYPKSIATAAAIFGSAGVLFVCASGLYCITLLLATFLDDVWRMWGSVAVFAALSWLFNHTPALASANIFRAMGDGLPLLAHALPWTAMAFSLELASILFFAALKVVQLREY
jgi:hypothetical protein